MITPLLCGRCSLETLAPQYSAETGESAGQWIADADNVPCSMRLMRGGETVRGRAVYKRASHVLYMPFREINPAFTRVKYDGRVFRVDAACDLGGKRRLTALYVEEFR